MTLLTWFDTHDINPDDCLCVSLGTDGLKTKDSQLMSISYARGLSGPPTTIYTKQPMCEAEAFKVEQYTGISQKTYLEKAVYFNEALNKLAPILDDTEFVVSYSLAEFYRPWAREVVTPLIEIPALDIQNIFKLKDRAGIIRSDIDTIEELERSISEQTAFIKAGYSIPALVDRYLGYKSTLPLLELKPEQIQLLFNLSLQMTF